MKRKTLATCWDSNVRYALSSIHLSKVFVFYKHIWIGICNSKPNHFGQQLNTLFKKKFCLADLLQLVFCSVKISYTNTPTQ